MQYVIVADNRGGFCFFFSHATVPRLPSRRSSDRSFASICVEACDELPVGEIVNERAVSHALLLAHDSPNRQPIMCPHDKIIGGDVKTSSHNRGRFWWFSRAQQYSLLPRRWSHDHQYLQPPLVEARDELSMEELVNEGG